MSYQNVRSNHSLDHISLQEERTRLLLNAKRIISFSPHPDDSELIAGGYLANAIDRKAEVKLVVVSDDRMSFTSIENELPMEKIVAIRKDEEISAVEVLGATVTPNAIVSIDSSIDRKIRSILCHKSQFPNAEDIEQKIPNTASIFGRMISCRYGEAFKVLLPDEIHTGMLALG